MAEDEDGSSDKNSNKIDAEYTNHDSNSDNINRIDSANNIEIGSDQNAHSSQSEEKINNKENNKKEENPFSFRHFLKRDLSLPGNSTFENTGARPKVYAKTVQHSPKKAFTNYTPSNKNSRETNGSYLNSGNSSSSMLDAPFVPVDNSDSKNNLYIDYFDTNGSFHSSPNAKSENMGMPSLPDFVQDHILVEQAYLNSNGPVSVDLDNLPDFTYNTNYDSSTASLGRRNNRNCGEFAGEQSDSNARRMRNGVHGVPLDLPHSAEGANQAPLDLPQHLNLDLTESIGTSDRRNAADNRHSFPLDLPPGNAGAEGLRLPDFLPANPGRSSPEHEHAERSIHNVIAELERTRSQLASERAHRIRLQSELAALRAQENEPQPSTSSGASSNPEATIAMLRNQLRILQERHSALRDESAALRRAAAGQLQRAADAADTSLRDLLAGVEQLRRLGANLDPTL